MTTEILDTYDFDRRSKEPVRRENSYPWGTWFDGHIYRITQKADFPSVQPLMMERIIRTRASAKKVRVRVAHEEGGAIVFQANVGGGHPTRRRHLQDANHS
jgi:hypothetical protein